MRAFLSVLATALPIVAGGSSAPSLAPHVRGATPPPQPLLPGDISKKLDKGYKKGLVDQQDFNMLCQVVLTKESTAGKLTQEEYASFVFDYCDHAPNRGDSCVKKTIFAELPMPLQQLYVSEACHEAGGCPEATPEKGEPIPFHGETQKLCLDTYAKMLELGMLVDPTNNPSMNKAVTTAPSLRPSILKVTAPVASASPSTAPPSLRPTNIETPVDPVNSSGPDASPTTSIPQNEQSTAEESDNDAKEGPPHDDDDDDEKGMSTQGIILSVAAAAALVLTKVVAFGAYMRLRKHRKQATINDFDPYLQEHSALGSEPSISPSIANGKPCEHILVVDPLSQPKKQDHAMLSDERQLRLGTSLFDERLLPYCDEIPGLNEVKTIGSHSISGGDDDSSHAGSGTKNDPIPIIKDIQPSERWHDSRKKWRKSREGTEYLTLEALPSTSANVEKQRRRQRNGVESCSLSSSNSSRTSSSAAISIDDEIRQRFREFDESVTGGIETLRSELSSGYGTVEASSSQDSADDSISVHINRRGK